MLTVLKSKVDDTINEVYEDGSEFRCVERADNTTVYLSSHTGCSLGCQMCHLTTTGQTKMLPLSDQEMYFRATRLVNMTGTKPLNYSFMARGDALVNANVDGALVRDLLGFGYTCGRHSKVSLSTIFPKKVVGDDIASFLFTRFGPFPPMFYWSLYSLSSDFRARWLPEAQDPETVAMGLLEWQRRTGMDIVIHHALIDGENDGTGEAIEIIDFLNDYHLRYRVNLVMYNPPDNTSREAHHDRYLDHWKLYNEATRGLAKIQARVGPDVFASCGLFFDTQL